MDKHNAGIAQALGSVPSGLFVLTFRHGPRTTGLLASWVQQCSFEPPGVSFCLRNDRYHLDWVREGAALRLHVLGSDQGKPLLKHFAAGHAPDADAFIGIPHDNPENEAPLLHNVVAWLTLTPTELLAAGDHCVVVGQVRDGAFLGTDSPWVHLRKSGLSY